LVLLFLKGFSSNIYTPLHVQLWKHFFHSDWDTSKTWILNASIASFGDKNCWPCIFLLICGNKKSYWGQIRAVRRITHQSDVLAGQKLSALRWCVRARIVMVHKDPPNLVRFSNFSEDFTQTNCGVPTRIDRPSLLKRNSRHMTSSTEETGDHLIWSASFTNYFRWIWLILWLKVTLARNLSLRPRICLKTRL